MSHAPFNVVFKEPLSEPRPLTILVEGKPVAWRRLRLDGRRLKTGAKGVFFPAAAQEQQTKAIQWAARQAMRGRPILTGAVALVVTSFLPVPQSWSKKEQAAALVGAIRPIAKPDWDNFGKLPSDALNGIVYVDDAQVVEGRSVKFYSDRPRLRIDIIPITTAASKED